MLRQPGSPHRDRGIEQLRRRAPTGALSHLVREDLERDQRGGAGRMCRREQRRGCQPAADRDQDRLVTPETSNTAVMLSAHCSNVGRAPAVTGSDTPVPGWSKKISRPSDVIASTHP
ncbi:hypothetical protein I547_6276 [Mycobacterium kansasii 824]|nr:hypothetical protein I547_6276 [Mycobacterium kansasii 824]